MRVTLRALALAMAVLAGWQARAAEPDALPPAVYTHVATPARQVAAAAMLRLAAQAGQARVIIGLALTLGSPATLNEAQESAQTTRLRGLQRAMLQRTLGRSTGDDLRLYRVIPFVAATVTAAQLARLFADPDVRTVELDRQSQPAALGYDMTLIEADEVWARGFRGAGYTVVVLDTGVQLTHPVFAGKIVAQGCFSSNFAGYSSLCPGGAASSLAPGSGAACAASVCNHGTYVASIAVGNGAGFEGVAPAASLIPVQMNSFSASVATCYPRPAPCVTSYMSDQVSALEQVQTWSKSFKIAAVNMSTGAGSYPAACDSIFPAQAAIVTALRSQGVLTAIASGNDSLNGSIAAPACLSSAVAVGSTDAADSVSSFSNQSSLVKLMAPGSNITGAIPGGGFTVGSGTSLAAPHVAGAIALLRRAAPSWASPEDVLSALACASQPVTRANLTKPRIDVLWADNYLNYLPPGTWNWTFSKPAAVAAWRRAAATASPPFLRAIGRRAGFLTARPE
jgi:subtilisin family serine protease